jgi:collagenase-like PrtC family protease
MKMKYSIATNFDEKLIEAIAKMDMEKSIKSVFGKLKSDAIGGGRPAMFLPEVSFQKLADYIQLCHKNGIEFNYLLNPMCLGNKELTADGQKEIIKFMGELADIKIDWFTINSPALARIAKRKFPQIKISVGVHALVSELQHIKNWENLDVDEITLQMYLSRNFPMLERMLNYTKGTKVGLRVFANTLCLHNCSYRASHSTGQSHASRTGDPTEKYYLDVNTMTCTYEKIKNPAHLIAAEWIRPEDVKHYERLCEKTGNNNFTIKLVERTKSTEFLIRVAKAYLDQSYDGNLLDLMLWPSVKSPLAILSRKEAQTMPAKDMPLPEGFKIFKEYYTLPEINIENKKLDGFFNKFIETFDCTEKVCEVFQPSKEQIAQTDKKGLLCSYCKIWAQKSISYEQSAVDGWLEKSGTILNSISY